MKTKILGRSGIKVTELGFGARWLLTEGDRKKPFADMEILLNKVLDLGINHIDTAAGYGNSEELMGKILGDRLKDLVISSKCWSKDPDTIKAALDKSLKLLNRDYLDIYIIHDAEATFDMLPLLQQFKEEGLIKAIGINAWHGDEDLMIRGIEDGRADILQIALTLTHRGMIEKGVIRMAEEKNLGLQIMGPLNSGILTGKAELCTELNTHGIESMDQAALKFLIDRLPNGVPIPGTSNVQRLIQYAKAADLETIDDKTWESFYLKLQGIPKIMELK